MSVYSVVVRPSSVTIKTGSWYNNAYAEVNACSDCCKDVEWYSDTPSVATVNPDKGYIYGMSPGTAKIYARSKVDGGKRDYVTVTVTSGTICVESVRLNRTSVSVEKGHSFTLTATVCPDNATNKTVCWSSDNTAVATVSNGVVSAKAKGETYIYAEADDDSGECARCYVTVTEDILVSSVTVNPPSKTMRVGDSDFLHATVCPKDATDKGVLWTSSNPGVATVILDSGLVFAHSVGQTTIRATPRDGGADPGEYVLTVEPAIAVTDIKLEMNKLMMNVGDTKEKITTIICPPDATNKRVTWRSSNPDIVSVDYYTGEITANAPGEVTITAETVDGGYTANCTVRVIIERVTIRKDSYFNEVIFESSGKVWKCVNCDTLYDEQYSGDCLEVRRAFYNFLTHYNEDDNTSNNTNPKVYTDDEIKLLYAIDPYGVADYVKRYAVEEFYKGDGLRSSIAYKDRIFKLLYNRDPNYFKRDLLGNWGRIIEPIDPDDVNWSTIISESETLFGMHPVYDLHTLVEFLSVAVDIIGILFGYVIPLNTAKKEVAEKIVKFAARVVAVGESVVKNDLASFATDFVIERAFEQTDLDWAHTLVSSFDDWMGIFNSIIDTPNYTGELVTYCANYPNYLVFAELENGEKRLLDDICADINN